MVKNIKEKGKNILLEMKNNLEKMGTGQADNAKDYSRQWLWLLHIAPENNDKNAIRCWENGQQTINQKRNSALSSSEKQAARTYKYARADVSV